MHQPAIWSDMARDLLVGIKFAWGSEIVREMGVRTIKKQAQVISPAACGALFQCSHHPASLAEPRGTLVEPSWNLASGSPRTTPEPIWAETPKFSAVGEK